MACRRACTSHRAKAHQWQELRHQLFKANAELEWFERYVMGRDLHLGAGPRAPP